MNKFIVTIYKIVGVGLTIFSLAAFAGPKVFAQATPTITSLTGCPSGSTNCKPNTIYPGGIVTIRTSGMAVGDNDRIKVDFDGRRIGVSPLSATLTETTVIAPNDLTGVTKIRLLGEDGTPDSNDFTVTVGNGGGTPTGGVSIVSVSGCKDQAGTTCSSNLVSAGDKALKISGSGFSVDSTVTINNQAASVQSFNPNNPSEIFVNYAVPANGQLTVIVDSPGGTDTKILTIGTTATPGGGTPGGGGVPITPKPVTPVSSDLDCKSQGLGDKTDPVTGLCIPTNPLKATDDSLASATSIGDLIKRILNILLTLGGVVAVLFIVLGGYEYITSRGSEERAKSGRRTMTYAIIGLVAILLAFMLVTVLTNLFTQGKLFS